MRPVVSCQRRIIGRIAAHRADMRELIPQLVADGVVCDAVVTDPPYHLLPTVKRFGDDDAKHSGYGRDGSYHRLQGGFMGQQWDGGDIAFRPETWATVASIMRPGAFLVAFGGTRTYHRLVCAIEDAGFVIQDTIAWLYGSGFPKRRDMLKPAFEPILLAYKPGGKRTMQVDECRIATSDDCARAPSPLRPGAISYLRNDTPLYGGKGSDLGRWPANVVHDGSEEVLEAFAAFGEKTTNHAYGTIHSGAIWGKAGDHPVTISGDTGTAARFFYCGKAGELDRWQTPKHELTLSWSSESGLCQARLLVATALSPAKVIVASGSIAAEEWSTFLFGSGLTDLCRKASKSTIKMTTSSTTDLKTWSWLTHSLTNDFTPVAASLTGNGSNLVENAENASLSISFILAETASLPNANHALSGARFEISGREKRGSHPTVKPLALMRWLVKLVTPPDGLVLDPFAGSGTTGVAALAEGRRAILIEREQQYFADIEERLAYHRGDGAHSLAAKHRARPAADHGPLFR